MEKLSEKWREAFMNSYKMPEYYCWNSFFRKTEEEYNKPKYSEECEKLWSILKCNLCYTNKENQRTYTITKDDLQKAFNDETV